MILFSVIFFSFLLQTVNTSKRLIQADDPRITQLLASHYDCWKQYNLKQFSLTRVRKCTQVYSEIE